LLTSCGHGPPIVTTAIPPAPATTTIYVVERGWHTDIGLPVGPGTGRLVALEDDFPGVRYLVFGFGEFAYSVADRQDFGHMLWALVPGPGISLVTALKDPPADAFGAANVTELHVSQPQLDRLAEFVWATLDTSGGAPHRLREGPYPGSEFYRSTSTYAAFYTCNTWVAEALAAAGLPVNPWGVLFAGEVIGQVRQIARRSVAIRGTIVAEQHSTLPPKRGLTGSSE
jgi:uncharacterized protein (TIGR02117 family)